jgi:hypothetical protein
MTKLTGIFLRVELRCGENETIPKTEAMYEQARQVAAKFGIRTYFDRAWDHGDEFCDGYIYPTTENVIDVLNALDAVGVDYDNVDIQECHTKLLVFKKLMERFHPLCGVVLNVQHESGVDTIVNPAVMARSGEAMVGAVNKTQTDTSSDAT